jgi:hypothetical protein
MRGTFEQWQKFAPVLDKDLNKLKTAYFEAKKPINNYIKKQESNVIAIKESLILKVEAIDGEDGDLNIKKFNDLKNEWKKAGSAGRKHDNKLWDKFNKSADRLFNAKKEVIDAEIVLAENILKDLKDKTISTQDAETKLNELKNIQKTKEYNNVVSNIKNLKNEKIKEAKASKLSEYNKIFSVINDKKDATISLSKLIEAAISKSINNKKTDKKALLYSCIKLEILANLESLKKDAALRQQIQLEMLTSKFNKSNSGDLNDLDSLVINFIENYSKEDSGAPEKALWNRISKTLEVLVS